jgi:hypothetical protein
VPGGRRWVELTRPSIPPGGQRFPGDARQYRLALGRTQRRSGRRPTGHAGNGRYGVRQNADVKMARRTGTAAGDLPGPARLGTLDLSRPVFTLVGGANGLGRGKRG